MAVDLNLIFQNVNDHITLLDIALFPSVHQSVLGFTILYVVYMFICVLHPIMEHCQYFSASRSAQMETKFSLWL